MQRHQPLLTARPVIKSGEIVDGFDEANKPISARMIDRGREAVVNICTVTGAGVCLCVLVSRHSFQCG